MLDDAQFATWFAISLTSSLCLSLAVVCGYLLITSIRKAKNKPRAHAAWPKTEKVDLEVGEEQGELLIKGRRPIATRSFTPLYTKIRQHTLTWQQRQQDEKQARRTGTEKNWLAHLGRSSDKQRINSFASLKTHVPDTINAHALPYHYGGGLPPPTIPPFRPARTVQPPPLPLPFEKPLPVLPLRIIPKQAGAKNQHIISPLSPHQRTVRCSSFYDSPPSLSSSPRLSSIWSLASPRTPDILRSSKDHLHV